MALTENLGAADLAAIVGNNNGDSWGNGNAWWWIVILLLFANNGWGGWGNNGSNMYPPAMPQVATANDVNSGFAQMSVMNGIGDIANAINNGFANSEVSRTNMLANLTSQLNNAALVQQQNCFDNRLAVANLNATIAQEACADRQTVNDGVRDIMASNVANTQALLNTINGGIQAIQDKLCQQEIDALKTQNANLQTQLNLASLKGSQDAQTAAILAGQAANTQALEQYLNPSPIPAYVVQNPNCCVGQYNYGCGCGN